MTDEQWQLIEPILATPAPAPARRERGRPPQSARAVLDAILWKIRADAAWHQLPPFYPSQQTCRRYYRAWADSGLLKATWTALYKDLSERGGLDIKSVLKRGEVQVTPSAGKINFTFAPHLQNTWQASTASVLLRLVTRRALQIAGRGKSQSVSVLDEP
ncbi:MAG TPA: transposase [Anaerolineales bacterium]|nr:transposase [Anaerolineales bacterium]